MIGANQRGGGTSFGYDTSGRLSSSGAKWLGWTDTANGKESGLGLDSDYKSFGKYNLTDRLGSVVGQVDPSTGVISNRSRFVPFGEPAAGNAGFTGFCGRDYVASGVLYFRNRMYSPLLGRFLSEDPIGFSGSPDGNFFAYCGNDPVNFSDPLGLSPLGDGFMTGVSGLADGGVDAISFLGDPNQWNNYGWTLVPDEYNPGVQLRKWYRDYTAPTYGSYRCMEGYGVSHGLAEFGAGVVFSHGAGMAMEGLGIGRGVAAKGAVDEPGCFVAGTLVTIGNGEQVPIETVKRGDTLLSRDPDTGKIEAKEVKSTSKVTRYELVTVEFADPKTGAVLETITGTKNHPFWVPGKGWVALGIGTSVVTRAGPHAASTAGSSSSGTLVVKSSRWESHSEGVAVYNFIVKGFHTYFVGGDKGSGVKGGLKLALPHFW